MKLNNQGSLIIEVLVSIAMATVFFLAIGSLAMANNRVITTSKNETQATALAKEAMEQVLAVKYQGWVKIEPFTNKFVLVVVTNDAHNNRNFQLNLDNGVPAGETLNGLFRRTVYIGAAYRDIPVNGQLTTDSRLMNVEHEDDNTRRVEVRVSWPEKGAEKNVNLVTYITNWNIPSP